jgi:two-component system alkaline phosphatase synthesis response regulator PhoP
VKKILIIDDDAELRVAMKTVLGKAYELREAGSRKQALETMKTYRPDLVLLDVMMESNTTGFELAREIKGSARLKNAKILMITNIDREMNLDYKKEAGDKDWLPVDDYIVKPVEPKMLLSKVQKLLP